MVIILYLTQKTLETSKTVNSLELGIAPTVNF